MIEDVRKRVYQSPFFHRPFRRSMTPLSRLWRFFDSRLWHFEQRSAVSAPSALLYILQASYLGFQLRCLGVLGSRVYGLRFSATCCGLDGNIGVNGATIDT